MIEAYFDGACKGNPGPGSYGFIILEDGTLKAEESREETHTTNNVAEYKAIILLLDQLVRMEVDSVTIYGDSTLVIQQIRGKWKVKAEHLKPLHQQATELYNRIPECKLEWMPRDKNEEVNRLIGGK